MKKGLTLVEILVVLAIIAIMAAILFPVFEQARNAGKRKSEFSGCSNPQLLHAEMDNRGSEPSTSFTYQCSDGREITTDHEL